MEIKVANECPFSENGHCYNIEKELRVENGHSHMGESGNVYICPFYEVLDETRETFNGICKIVKYLNKLNEKRQ